MAADIAVSLAPFQFADSSSSDVDAIAEVGVCSGKSELGRPGGAELGIQEAATERASGPVVSVAPNTLLIADDRMEPNDTYRTGWNIGTVRSLRNYQDLVLADRADYYRFRLERTGTSVSRITVSFQHRNGDIDVALLDASGRVIQRSTSRDDNEVISLDKLPAGQYGLHVYGKGGAFNRNYGIRFEPPLVDDRMEPNDSISSPKNLGIVTNGTRHNNLVMADAADFYRFQLPHAVGAGSRIFVSFAHNQGDIDAVLYDANHRPLVVANGSSNNESINLTGMAAGTYTLKIYGYEGASNRGYGLRFDLDDRFENNDSQSTAANLGAIVTTRTVSGLVMADSSDWYQFVLPQSAGPGSQISVDFQHARGDIDVGLYSHSGFLTRQSTGSGDTEVIRLDGLGAGTYFIRVYGYQGVYNPSYRVTINPGTQVNSGRNLWINFDGINISSGDLARWGADWSIPWTGLDPERDGIGVRPFLESTTLWTEREHIIAQILTNVQQDVSAYGIQVRRWNGSAVENTGETTIFVGHRAGHPHIAGDIDFGNNNATDIAFVGNEVWDSWSNTAIALSDVILHEAGHTWGLFHVNSNVNGTALPETMGLRYSTPQPGWLQNTSFMDRTFVEFRDHGGGRGNQNSHQTMLANFRVGSAVPSPAPGLFTVLPNGVLSVSLSEGIDRVEARRSEFGSIELIVNGAMMDIGPSITGIWVFSDGDTRDQVVIPHGLGVDMSLRSGTWWDYAAQQKVAPDWVAVWNGTAIPAALLDQVHDHTGVVDTDRIPVAPLTAIATRSHTGLNQQMIESRGRRYDTSLQDPLADRSVQPVGEASRNPIPKSLPLRHHVVDKLFAARIDFDRDVQDLNAMVDNILGSGK